MEQYVLKNQKRLRCGVTTGSCAAAAAEAAATQLLLGVKKREVMLHTPKGVTLDIQVYESEELEEPGVTYMVVKDSGDDPDVTDGAKIYVSVAMLCPSMDTETCFRDERYSNLYLDGGMGVTVGRAYYKAFKERYEKYILHKPTSNLSMPLKLKG